MPKKKSQKKDFPKLDSHHISFLVILFLIVSVSSYAVFVFIDSVGSYVNLMQANVVDGNYTVKRAVIVPRENPFSDIDITEDYSIAVLELYHLGVLDGYSDGTFSPDQAVNRAEFSKVLAESSDLDYTLFDSTSLANCFYDVRDLNEHWYSPPVCALKVEGAVQGYGDGNFGPAKNITMAEAYKIVLDVFNFHIASNDEITEIPYSDVDADDWFLAVANAVKIYNLNITSGADLFYPDQEISRAGVAILIYTAMDRKDLL